MSHPTTRREFLQMATAAPVALAAAGQAVAAELPQGRPNFVFILIDDLRFDALRCLGHPWVDTPHLDALAAGGMIFDRSYVCTALCSPSRASILSSTYAHQHGVLDNTTPLPERLTLFPSVLRGAGYRTGFIGKWHMGGKSDAPHPAFDRWVSFPGQGNYLNQTLTVDGAKVPGEGYLSDVLTDHAVQFIEGAGASPFCLFLAHKATHADFVPAPRHQGCYADKTYPRPASMANTDENYRGKPAWVRAQRNSWHGVDGMYNRTVDYDQFTRSYAETVRAVDDSVGRVVETLRTRGQLDNTIIVFTGDNGFLFGDHGLIDKRCFYEPSIRVPMIVHWPAQVKPGTTCHNAVINLDHGPTFLDAAGLSAPEGFQGRSYLPLLRGETPAWREDFLYTYFWERSFPQTPTVLGVHTGRYKLAQYHGIWDRYEMYDLDNDPEEQHNLLAEFLQDAEAGELDGLIARKATGETAELFKRLRGALRAQLEATGCRAEPGW